MVDLSQVYYKYILHNFVVLKCRNKCIARNFVLVFLTDDFLHWIHFKINASPWRVLLEFFCKPRKNKILAKNYKKIRRSSSPTFPPRFCDFVVNMFLASLKAWSRWWNSYDSWISKCQNCFRAHSQIAGVPRWRTSDDYYNLFQIGYILHLASNEW